MVGVSDERGLFTLKAVQKGRERERKKLFLFVLPDHLSLDTYSAHVGCSKYTVMTVEGGTLSETLTSFPGTVSLPRDVIAGSCGSFF
jgi:hypothetical protein